MTAVGAVLMAARLNSGSPNYGTGLELQAIAAAVIGGASLAGGRGDIRASLFGALTITIVQNGLNLNAVPTSTQNVVIGSSSSWPWGSTCGGRTQPDRIFVRAPARRHGAQ